MSVAYQAVGWNPQKKTYDRTMLLGMVGYLVVFIAVTLATHPEITAETLIIRGFGTLALVMLHVILSIGPLARIDPRFLPWLYNRRHMGVAMFVCALVHGLFSIIQFHAVGTLNPLVNVLVGNSRYDTLSQFPFQPLGLAALGIFFLMAATSHDFWLANLSAPVWKALHMLVYVAYGLVVAHVALGVLQVETHPILTVFLVSGFVWIVGLHLYTGFKEKAGDAEIASSTDDEHFMDVCSLDDIPESRARTVCLSGERVAVYKYDGKISAISSVCKHQNGPLGEGKVVDGCVVCPWHGYQYLPSSGQSPPPFQEKVPTFRARVVDGRVQVDPRPLPPGTEVEPATFTPRPSASASAPKNDVEQDHG